MNVSTADASIPTSPDARPLVSVIITTRNRPSAVRQAIESALRLDTTTFRLDLVVVDDGSDDDTPEVLGEYPVRVVRTTGLGIPGARNTGLHAAVGDFVNFLDDDDVLLAGAIEAQLAAFRAHPEYASVLGRAQRTDPNLVPFEEPFPDADAPSGWILHELLGYQPQIGTVLTRHEVAAQLGGFNARYAGDDEWDFHLRIAKQFPVGRVPQTVMLFRQRDGAEEEQQWRRTRYVREIFAVNTNHLPLRERLALRPTRWRMRGWNCYAFVRYAQLNRAEREYRRTAKSLYYAFRWSPPHTIALTARWLVRGPR